MPKQTATTLQKKTPENLCDISHAITRLPKEAFRTECRRSKYGGDSSQHIPSPSQVGSPRKGKEEESQRERRKTEEISRRKTERTTNTMGCASSEEQRAGESSNSNFGNNAAFNRPIAISLPIGRPEDGGKEIAVDTKSYNKKKAKGEQRIPSTIGGVHFEKDLKGVFDEGKHEDHDNAVGSIVGNSVGADDDESKHLVVEEKTPAFSLDPKSHQPNRARDSKTPRQEIKEEVKDKDLQRSAGDSQATTPPIVSTRKISEIQGADDPAKHKQQSEGDGSGQVIKRGVELMPTTAEENEVPEMQKGSLRDATSLPAMIELYPILGELASEMGSPLLMVVTSTMISMIILHALKVLSLCGSTTRTFPLIGSSKLFPLLSDPFPPDDFEKKLLAGEPPGSPPVPAALAYDDLVSSRPHSSHASLASPSSRPQSSHHAVAQPPGPSELPVVDHKSSPTTAAMIRRGTRGSGLPYDRHSPLRNIAFDISDARSAHHHQHQQQEQEEAAIGSIPELNLAPSSTTESNKTSSEAEGAIINTVPNDDCGFRSPPIPGSPSARSVRSAVSVATKRFIENVNLEAAAAAAATSAAGAATLEEEEEAIATRGEEVIVNGLPKSVEELLISILGDPSKNETAPWTLRCKTLAAIRAICTDTDRVPPEHFQKLFSRLTGRILLQATSTTR
eukprot:jgi/Bigna1/74678/fgenesh1_pg.30_\